MRKKCFSIIMLVSLLITLFPTNLVVHAEEKKTITIGTLQIDEETEYSFQNAYETEVYDGWYMNVKGGGTSNKTQVNVYPLDLTTPVTQRYKFTIIDADEKLVKVSPIRALDKYLNMSGTDITSKPGIILHNIADEFNEFYLKFQEDGSFYFVFKANEEYCIAPSSKSNAQTAQMQMIARKIDADAVEQRWYLCDSEGTRIQFNPKGTPETKSYYEMFGEDYIMLFQKYPVALNNDFFNGYMDRYFEQCMDFLNLHNNEEFIGSYLYSLKNGINILAGELFAVLGFSSSLANDMKINSVTYLLNALCEDESALSGVIEQVENQFAVLDNTYGASNELAAKTLVDYLCKACDVLSRGQIEEIVDEMMGNTELGLKCVDYGITLTADIIETFKFYTLQISLVEELQKSLDPETDLYKDLEVVKNAMIGQPLLHFVEILLANGVQDFLCGSVASAIAGGGGTLAAFVAQMGIVIIVDGVYQGALADEIVQMTLLYSYAGNLRSAVWDMQKKFMQGEIAVTEETITQYEILFNTYLGSMKAMLECAMSMAKNSADKQAFQDSLNYLKNWNSYDVYVGLCLRTAQDIQDQMVVEKLDELLKKLGADKKTVYFTQSQKACSSSRLSEHGCDNCNNEYILDESWFTELFGELTLDQYPTHTVNGSKRLKKGRSCFGFGCFAQWYVYASETTDKVVAERVSSGIFNKEYIQENVRVGDVLRCNGHSFIVYGIEDNRLEVVDCNWNSGGQKNCVVQKHYMSYTHEQFAGYAVYVNRVVKVASTEKTEVIASEVTPAPVPTDIPVSSETTQKVVYSYTDREVTTSNSSTLAGWNLYNTTTEWVEVVAPTTEVLTAGAGEKIETEVREVSTEKMVYRYSNYFWVDSSGVLRKSSIRLVPSSYTKNKTITLYKNRYSGTYTNSGSVKKSTGKYNVWYSEEYDTPLDYTKGNGWKDSSGTTWYQDASYVTTTTEQVTYYRKLKVSVVYHYERYITVEGLTERPEEKEGRVIKETIVH